MRDVLLADNISSPQTRRLHVSPFDRALLPLILPPPILECATSISYHEIQTFPDRSYGYVTLPVMDAEIITKKLNGSILKGSRIKVAEARPEKTKRKLQDIQDEDKDRLEKKKKPRKSRSEGMGKREDGVLPGVELPRERRVKRGWTDEENVAKGKERKEKKEGAYKKAKTKSTYTNGREVLFKTTLPPNATPVTGASSKKQKGKKGKKGNKAREVVVHEFANTTKEPAFLRDSQGVERTNGTAEFVDGKGWVNSMGEILEAEPKNIEKARKGRSKQEEPTEALKHRVVLENKAPKSQVTAQEADETSSSGSSSPRSASSSSSNSDTSPGLNRLSITRSSATPPRLATTPPPPTPPQPHPLETLFKRPQPPTSTPSSSTKKPNLEVSTSFSFFDDDDPGAMTGLLAPRTPATQMDITNRRQRSAAPTPDTAMPGKSFWGGPAGRRSESLEVDDVSDGGLPDLGHEGEMMKRNKSEKKEESAFAKEFWEKRGERNRAVKRRVREAKKERRQKENRRGRG